MKLTLELEGVERKYEVDENDITSTDWGIIMQDMLDSKEEANKI